MLFTYFSFIKLFYFNSIISFLSLCLNWKQNMKNFILHLSYWLLYWYISSNILQSIQKWITIFYPIYLYGSLFFRTQTNRRTISTHFLLFTDGFRLVSLSAVKPYFMRVTAFFIFCLLLWKSVFFSKLV